jgi:glycosyltransferase involved in cell wall biosynthesis
MVKRGQAVRMAAGRSWSGEGEFMDRMEPSRRRLRIALISNYQLDRSESMLRYAWMLESGLRARGYTVTRLHPPAIFGRLPIARGRLTKWIRYIDKYLVAPPYLRWHLREADLVHVCDHSNSMYLRCAGKKPHAITCHDLLAVLSAQGRFAGENTGVTGRLLQRWIASSLIKARYVICVSHKTHADLLELAPDMRATFKVIHHPLNWRYAPASEKRVEQTLSRLGVPREHGYLLHVGGNQWYKNRLGTMRIFAQLRNSPVFSQTRLIMAGKPWTREMVDFRKSAQLEEVIIEATDISNDDLCALYTGALAFLFPSREEGFGWPILEAQACGCPVITTDRPPMTEIAGNAAILIDSTNPEQAARTIQQAWHRRAELRAAGFENLRRFTEERAMQAYCAAYEEIVGVRIETATTA